MQILHQEGEEVTCLNCGQCFASRRKGANRYCSRSCYDLARAAMPSRPKARCAVESCDHPVRTDDLCSNHYLRRWKGWPDWDTRPLRVRGDGYRNRAGYVLVSAPEHPNAQKNGRIFQHVLVMANHLGRPLLSEENVHHVNGQRHDNRIENLELWSTRQPKGQRVTDKLAFARELIAIYGTDKEKAVQWH